MWRTWARAAGRPYCSKVGQLWVSPSAPKIKCGLKLDCLLCVVGGAAFGSGEHATTVMCCQWLEAYLAKHKGEVNLLDYGSGSGILGTASHSGACGG